MNTFARITMDSLKTYFVTVQRVADYSSVAIAAMSDFDNLVNSIGDEIKNLEEKKGQLVKAESIIENKITEYETKIEETKSYICKNEKDLDNTKSKLETISETFTIYLNGDLHEIPNPDYSALKIKMAKLERLLAKAYLDLDSWESRLVRCHAVERELAAVLSSITNRISKLNNFKSRVENNKKEYNSAVVSVRKNTSHAISKLSMAERSLNEYVGIHLKVNPAFEAVKREGGSGNLNDLAYLSSKFKNAPSRDIQHEKKDLDDDGKIFRNDNGLIPNSSFRKNGYIFTTDHLGRPISASGKLRLAKETPKRDWDSTLNEIGQGDEKDGDDRGHIIGHRFYGPDSILNAFPQDVNINRGEYNAFENFLASELESGKEVFVSFSPIYKGDSRRPTGVAISYTIDGVRKMRYFNNESKDGK